MQCILPYIWLLSLKFMFALVCRSFSFCSFVNMTYLSLLILMGIWIVFPLGLKLESQGFCNKEPQTGWFKTMEIYCLLFWSLEVQNQGACKAMFPLRLAEEKTSLLRLASDVFLPAILGFSWLVNASPNLCLHRPMSI